MSARDDPLIDRNGFVVPAFGAEHFGDMFIDEPISWIRRICSLIMQQCFFVSTTGEIQKAALHLQPRVSAHLLCSQLVFCLLVKKVGTGCIADLTAEMCQASQSTPGPLVLQDYEIAALGRSLTAVL